MKSCPLIVGLDIGTNKSTLSTGNFNAAGQVEIMSVSTVKSKGMERGLISNLTDVAGMVEEVVRKAEEKLNSRKGAAKAFEMRKFKISSVYTTIGGEHIIGNNSRSTLNLSNRPVQINRQNISRLIDAAKFSEVSMDKEILHVLEQEFVINGSQRLKNPIGIFGKNLTLNLHVISCDSSQMNTVIKAVNRAGLDVEGVVFSGLATSSCVLSEQEKQNGVILLELGAGVSNVLFFKDGSLFYTSILPQGGSDITEKIAQHFGIDFTQAEQLKMQYRNLYSEYAQNTDEKIIIKKSSSLYESIKKSELAAIIDGQLNCLFKAITDELNSAQILGKAKEGIVIAGGMAFMDGIIEKLEEISKTKVTLGIMRGFVSNISGISNTAYSTGVGLVMHILNKKVKNSEKSDTIIKWGILSGLITKIKSIYEDYF
ncbi:MAG: cell division protein FtsA [Candidatus Omnitrophica bacterium]|nr:cell division protein FtsA [Candidatus Omnitrophota bacterium]